MIPIPDEPIILNPPHLRALTVLLVADGIGRKILAGMQSSRLARMLRLTTWLFLLWGMPAISRAQGPVLIQEVISREQALFTGADPDYKVTLSREVALFVGADPDAKEIVSREVSLVLADSTPPPVVTGLTLTLSARRDTVTLDWSSYNQWAVRDVAAYEIYYAPLGYSTVTGMTPFRTLPGETFTTTFTDMPEYGDFFFAVVPVDAQGNRLTTVTPVSNYALTKEIVSREVALFSGHEDPPAYRQLISREVSLVVSNPAPPPPVTNPAITFSPTGKDITISWPDYNQWAARDVSHYEIYRSTTPFTTVSGLTPVATVAGENFTRSFTGMTENQDSFWAVVAVDGQGNRETNVSYKGVYLISPQSISREVALFTGHEPAVPIIKEVVSREMSFVLGSAAVPAPVTGIGSGFAVSTSVQRYSAIDVDWTSYNEAAQRDVASYRIYVGSAFFDSVTGLTPHAISMDGSQKATILVDGAEQIYFVAVVAVDVLGNFNPTVYAESVKASAGALGDVSNVVATPTPSTIAYTWDLGGVGTNLQNFVREFRIYFDGPNRPNTGIIPLPVIIGPTQRSWTATSLAFSTTYTARITTVDMLGQESPGVTVLATTPTVPAGAVEAGWNPGADGQVYTTVMDSPDTMLAAGDFSQIGGVSRSRLARLDLNGTVLGGFAPVLDGLVYSLLIQNDGKILVGGAFTNINGQARTRLARLHPDGALDPTFAPVINDTVRGVALQADGKIILGGSFTSVNGVSRISMARLHADGSLDTGFTANANTGGIVRPVALLPDGRILAGGNFTSIGGVARNRLAILLTNGAVDTSVAMDANADVQTLSVSPVDGSLLVGGAFSAINGLARNGLARFTPSLTLDAGFQMNTNAGSNLWSIVRQTDGRILIGGGFTSVNGVARNRCARLLADGTLDSGFNPDLNGLLDSIMLQPDGKIVLTGGFTTAGGLARNRMSRHYNTPAVSNLSITDYQNAAWERGGSSSEASDVRFEISTDQGLHWTLPGLAVRTAQGWSASGLALPPQGILRGRARTRSGIYGGSSGFVETRLAYNVFADAASWQQFYFHGSTTGSAAPQADADGDGLSNLIERAFGQNPLAAAERTLPQWQWSDAYGTATFQEPPGTTGILYGAEWSTSLQSGDWHPIPDTGQSPRHTFTFPLNGAPHCFVRWKIIQLPAP